MIENGSDKDEIYIKMLEIYVRELNDAVSTMEICDSSDNPEILNSVMKYGSKNGIFLTKLLELDVIDPRMIISKIENDVRIPRLRNKIQNILLRKNFEEIAQTSLTKLCKRTINSKNVE